MRIDNRTPTPPSLLGAVAAPSAESFGDVLAGQAQASGVEPAAFGALGMFGRRAAVADAATPTARSAGPGAAAPAMVQRPGPLSPLETGPGTGPGTGAQTQAGPKAAGTPPSPADARGGAGASMRARVAAPTGPEAVAIDGDAGPERSVGPADVPPDAEPAAAPGGGRTAPSTRPPGAAGPQLRLGAGAGGWAEVIVGTPALSDDEVRQFRDRARAVLGEHGLGLDSIRINGEVRSPTSTGRGDKPWR